MLHSHNIVNSIIEKDAIQGSNYTFVTWITISLNNGAKITQNNSKRNFAVAFNLPFEIWTESKMKNEKKYQVRVDDMPMSVTTESFIGYQNVKSYK